MTVILCRQTTLARLGRLLLLGLAPLAAGCGSSPPSRSDDICVIFAEKPDWHRAALAAQLRWGAPLSVALAIIRHESAFVADARPPRRRFLWIFPGRRPSSAYGYPQALDATWEDYRRVTGRSGADRDDFADAVDFVGWYNDRSRRRNGIKADDAYNLYLAYYLGHAGYARGRYRDDRSLQDTARRVAATAAAYRRQLGRCPAPPRRSWFF